MGKFLRENWIWIVVPIVVVLVGLLILIKFMSGDSGNASPFDYNL